MVCVRGTIASRRAVGPGYDFETFPLTNGWTEEEFFRLCARNNRRAYWVHHPTDTFGAADLSGSGGNGGSYQSAASYDAAFMAPIRAEYPRCDVRFVVDQGTETHAFNSWNIPNAILPAVSTPLASLARVRTAARLGLRAA